MKKFILLITTLFLSLSFNLSNAQELESTWVLDSIEYTQNVMVWESWSINLDSLSEQLSSEYNSNILFEWSTTWESTVSWTSYEKSFDTFWQKSINLNIYKTWANQKELILNKEFRFFVYKESIAFIFEDELWEKMNEYINKSNEAWVFIYNIWTINIRDIEKYNFTDKINEYNVSFPWASDYVVIWWSKEFLFDTISKINSKISNKQLNLVLISSFNISILKSYFGNFIANKTWIKTILLLDEWSKFEIIRTPNSIENLEVQINKNWYEYVNLSDSEEISEFFFISKFINILSNKWFSTNNIYLILIIPFLLVWVSFFKHFIWLTPTWTLIPVIITLLLFKLGLIATLIILLVFLSVNLILARLISSSKLHYTPKATLLTIINIVVLIVVLNFMIINDFIQVNINDIMFIIFFILISDKLISVIVSKEFGEYKETLIITLLYAIISYIFLSINLVQTFILAYPEIILLLIPINFIIGKFTWLRATEYFRFREVIKSIEE